MRPCRASAFVINAPTYSDGDPTLKPTRVSYTLTPTNSDAFHTYLQKIATKWMDEEAGGAEKGSLPSYYCSCYFSKESTG